MGQLILLWELCRSWEHGRLMREVRKSFSSRGAPYRSPDAEAVARDARAEAQRRDDALYREVLRAVRYVLFGMVLGTVGGVAFGAGDYACRPDEPRRVVVPPASKAPVTIDCGLTIYRTVAVTPNTVTVVDTVCVRCSPAY